MRQIRECPVQREISYHQFIRAAEAVLAFTPRKAEVTRAVRAVRSSRVRELGLSLPSCALLWQLLRCLRGEVEKQRRWPSSTPLAWARVKDMHATVLPYTNGHLGPVLLSAVTYALVYQDGLITRSPACTL